MEDRKVMKKDYTIAVAGTGYRFCKIDWKNDVIICAIDDVIKVKIYAKEEA